MKIMATCSSAFILIQQWNKRAGKWSTTKLKRIIPIPAKVKNANARHIPARCLCIELTNWAARAEGTEVYIWAVGKADQKKEFVGSGDEMSENVDDSSSVLFDSPEAKIRASILTKKFFNNSRMLAEFVQDEFEKQGRVNRGVLQRNNKGIWVLQATAMPSILVETGYICNRDEESYLNNEKNQREIAYAIMRAVLRYKESLENGNIPVVSPATADTAQ